ncbi:hypothetical protein ACT4S5_13070 [Kocuria oceani]|uniref:hypothetical protein n=1 Tax=Kocuria oceani TaxID=988827 RepID=UPI0040358109
MNPNECPMCDVGVIYSYRVVATGETILICDECDSVWESAEELPGPATTTVEQHLAARGRPPLWSELARLDQAPTA